jgi:hypothetical protein
MLISKALILLAQDTLHLGHHPFGDCRLLEYGGP